MSLQGSSTASDRDLRLGRLAVEEGLLNADQLRTALAELARRMEMTVSGTLKAPPSLGDVLMEGGALSAAQLEGLRRRLDDLGPATQPEMPPEARQAGGRPEA